MMRRGVKERWIERNRVLKEGRRGEKTRGRQREKGRRRCRTK